MLDPLADALLSSGKDADAALVCGGASRTYAELRADVLHEARGMRRGERVIVDASSSVAAVVRMLAAFHAGATAIPIDPRWPVAVREARAGGGRVETASDPDALLMSTSGTSGAPKLVRLSRDGVAATVRAIASYLPVAQHPRTLIALPLAYSYALIGQLFTTLAAGATAVLHDGAQPLRVAVRACDGFSSVDLALRALANAMTEPDERLSYLGCAGGPLEVETHDALRRAFPRARIFAQYGLTEAGPRVAAIETTDAAWRPGVAGRAIAGVEAFVDVDDGELCVRGPSVMRGYEGDEEATARVLSNGVLRTGDRATMEAGDVIAVHGRTDDVVKVAGERVAIEAVERALAHGEIADVAILAEPSATLGVRLVALVVAAPGVDAQRARASTAERSREHLAPAERPVVIQVVAAVPRTATGKIARGELARVAKNAVRS